MKSRKLHISIWDQMQVLFVTVRYFLICYCLCSGSVMAGEAAIQDTTAPKPSVILDDMARPFLHFGNPISKAAHPEYFKAARKFPNIDSCLEDTEQQTDILNSMLAWKNIRSLKELDVCVFRIADGLNSISKLKSWMTRNGFRGFVLLAESEYNMSLLNTSGTGLYLNGGIPRANIKARFGWLVMLWTYYLSTSVTLDAEHRPVHIQSSVPKL